MTEKASQISGSCWNLGESGWDAETCAREHPAGMGLFSLCQSGVTVRSRNNEVNLVPEDFLGKSSPTVEYVEEFLRGTSLHFVRSEEKKRLLAALKEAALFCPVPVRFEGDILPSYDFLEGAEYRELIDGIEVGFAPKFEHDWDAHDDNYNFYGARIREEPYGEPSFLVKDSAGSVRVVPMHCRFNVLETKRIALQLPERRQVVKTPFLEEFKQKVQAAAYRYIQKLGVHVLGYRHWQRAKELGITLPEAVAYLTTWNDLRRNEFECRVFSRDKSLVVGDLTKVLLVGDVEHAYTLQAAIECGAKLGYTLYREETKFAGYTWYEALPRIADMEVFFDGQEAPEQIDCDVKRPETITLKLAIKTYDGEDEINLPAKLHVGRDCPLWDGGAYSFVAVQNSPWDKNSENEPFDIADFLMYAMFEFDPDGDTFDTQERDFRKHVEEIVMQYFKGPRDNLLAAIRRITDELSFKAELNVAEIRLKRSGPNWDINLLNAQGEQI